MTVRATMPRGVVRATGGDVAAYLQGQVSQDLEAIAAGESTWSLILDPSGKLIAWFRAHRLADQEFVLDCEPDTVDALVARLERFKLRTDAVFSIEADWQMTRHRAESPVDLAASDGDLIAQFEWPGFRCTDHLARVAAPITEVDAGFEAARIAAGVPRMSVDIDDETIPGEGGQALIDLSVSFTKGCYTGQELVARIDSRGGNVPRPLRVLEAVDALTLGASIDFEGQEIGTVTSVSGTVGLARVLRKAEIDSSVTVGGVAARVIAPTG